MKFKNNKYIYIGMHTLFFAILLPIIQSSQLYVIGVFKPILLVMPVVMGTLTGFLVGYYRQRNREHIWSLEKTQEKLEKQVSCQVEELRRKNDALHVLSRTDALTGLGNRLFLKEKMEEESQKVGVDYAHFCIIIADIDYFKNYNDFYGHLNGDKVLKKLGKIFFEYSKNKDIYAIRFGGEEFCLLLPNQTVDDAKQIAESLQKTIKLKKIPHQKSEISEYITVSMGVHATSKSTDLLDSIVIHHADEALYQAKDEGRNRIIVK